MQYKEEQAPLAGRHWVAREADNLGISLWSSKNYKYAPVGKP